MVCKGKIYIFSQIAIIIMSIVFVVNLVISRDCNLLWLIISGGGDIIDHLGASYTAVFEEMQIYRLVTYGYTQTAIWHLLANAFGIWYMGIYLERKIGIVKFMIVYHIGLVAAGIAILILFPSSLNYGASPAIFACMGVLINWLIRKRDLWSEYKSQKGFYYILYYCIFSNVLGISTLVIHFLGFSVGFLLGFVVKNES